MRIAAILAIILTTEVAGWLARADPRPSVDVILVLLVDVSGSVAQSEIGLQRNGYVAALSDPDLAEVIAGGQLGAIALIYVEWAGPEHQDVIIPCSVIKGRMDAKRLSQDLEDSRRTHGHGTSISAALTFAIELAAKCPARSPRLVIDVSGDGPSNAGPDIVTAREAALAAGATINGLPIALPANGEAGEHFGRKWLRRYYETCVSGGPGAFVLPVDDPSALHISILRKLVLEIALGQERLVYAREDRRAAFDCHLIGQTPGR